MEFLIYYVIKYLGTYNHKFKTFTTISIPELEQGLNVTYLQMFPVTYCRVILLVKIQAGPVMWRFFRDSEAPLLHTRAISYLLLGFMNI